MEELNSLQDLFVHELKDVYYAEKQITKALPKMARAAQHPMLRQSFEEHLEETKRQIERLEEVCRGLGIKPRGETCEAMDGIIEEGSAILKAKGDKAVRDAALILSAQRVEHYEICAYGGLVDLAKLLGHREAARLLAETLKEEKAADKKLNQLAKSEVNELALQAGEEEDMEDDDEDDNAGGMEEEDEEE